MSKPTEAQIAFVQANAGKLGDGAMAQQLGLTKRSVRSIRERFKLKGMASAVWPDADLDAAKARWEAGESRDAIGKALGRTGDAVKSQAVRLGWQRRQPVRKPEPTRQIAQDDQDLIAQFLAEKPVTQCPPGHACGLTMIERQVWVAGPPKRSIREVHAAAVAGTFARKRA